MLVVSANTAIVHGEEEILSGEVTTILETSNQVDSDIFKDESNLLYKIVGEGEVQVGDGKNPFYELDGMRKIVFGKNTNYIFQGFLGGSFTNLEEIQFNSEKLQIESGAFSFFSSTNQEKLLFTVVSEEAKEELMTKLGINENNIRIIDLVDPVDPVDPKTPVNPVDKDSKVDQNNSNKNNQGNNSDVKIINSHSGKTNQELLPKTNEKKSIISLVLGLGMLGVIPVIMKRKI
ncbi:LPXTG cell wall anchor domain-containing protein [Vagococcus fluvialis]|uniref:LPXTG cell wall anchor domain-containing protein n=1 Tax=Vagococcus fluvialis TaxID=2738 RepID=UPI001A8D6EB6|nr:LPXTG cell wall anchor domain-containing protein [Vagococcus fluvialis]MBO0486734.1 LPXTG cell wall anchor domain-containing protein [Vagococcus fluvialis]